MLMGFFWMWMEPWRNPGTLASPKLLVTWKCRKHVILRGSYGGFRGARFRSHPPIQKDQAHLLIFLGCDDTCNQRLSSICDLRWSYSFGLVRFKVSCGTGSLWTVSFWMGMVCHFDTASTQVWKVDPFDHCCTTDTWDSPLQTHQKSPQAPRTKNHQKCRWSIGVSALTSTIPIWSALAVTVHHVTSCYIMSHHVTSSYVYSIVSIV